MRIHITIVLCLVILCPNLNAQSGFFPHWIDDGGIDYTPGDEVIMKSISSTGWTAGARSEEVLASGDDGWIEYQVNEIQAGFRAFGFSSSDPNYHYTSMAYSFRFSTSTVYFQRGSTIAGSITFAVGDVFRIEKTGLVIDYIMNGVVRLSYTASSMSDMFVDTGINTQWNYFDQIRCSFGTTYDAEWTNRVGVSVSGGVITKNVVDGWGNSGLSSKNVIKPKEQGWIEYTPADTSGHLGFGFSFDDSDQKYVTMDYAMVLNSSGGIFGYHLGTLLFASTYSTNDILRIEKVGKQVNYIQNETMLFSSDCYLPYPLVADVSIYRNGTSFTDSSFRLSFDEEIYTFAEVVSLDYDTTATVNLTSYGGTQENRFYWGDSILTDSLWQVELSLMDSLSQAYLQSLSFDSLFFSTNSSRTFKETGKYSLISKDSLLGDSKNPIVVDYTQFLDTAYGFDFENKILTKTASTSTGGNARYLLQNGIVTGTTIGGFCIKPLKGLGADFRYGFSEDGAAIQGSGNQIEYGFSVSNGSLKTIYNGTLGSYEGKVFGNEELTLETTLDSIYYYKNDRLLLANTLPSGDVLRLDAFLVKQDGKLEVCWIDVDKPDKPIKPKILISNLVCGSSNLGTLEVSFPVQYCQYTFNLINEYNELIASNITGQFSNLEAGEYIIEVVPSVGCQFTTPWTYTADVGYVIDWTNLTNGVTTNQGFEGSNLFRNGQVPIVQMGAESRNMLNFGSEGWVEFEPGPMKEERGVIQLKGTNENFVAHLRYSNNLIFTSFLVFENGVVNEDMTYWTNEIFNTYRIQRKEGEYTIKLDSEEHSFPLADFPRVFADGRIGPLTGGLYDCRASFGCPEPIVQYAELSKKVEPQVYYAVDNTVHFIYFNEYLNVDETLIFNVYDDKFNNVNMNLLNNPEMAISKHGRNEYSMDVTELLGGEGEFYILEIINDKNEKRYLRFSI